MRYLAFALTLAFSVVALADTEVPAHNVLVQVIEKVPDAKTWAIPPTAQLTTTFTLPQFGIIGVPRAYDERGLIADRSPTFLLRATSRVKLSAGKRLFLLRSMGGARLRLDGKEIARTRFLQNNGDGHEPVPDLPAAAHAELRALPPGHAETLVEVTVSEGEHLIELTAQVGGARRRPEIGELLVATAIPGAAFELLGPTASLFLTDDAWERYASKRREELGEWSTAARREKSAAEDRYWTARHELARRETPKPPSTDTIDRFVNVKLAAAGAKPTASIDDWTFLRRISLDLRGIIPTRAEAEEYGATNPAHRRALWIERFLHDSRWADHWVSYWQDVLAENPGILKPKLNNTGPFRWWLHESFSDNKPIDRLATELILMGGSTFGGGPAGFRLATQNDVPMAAKAHVIGTAFLGVQMKCARCHDAPYHPYGQKDLFSIAAMLGRGPLSVPKTSSVPRSAEELESMIVEVTLAPGAKVEPDWPFAALSPSPSDLGRLTRRENDTRERIAAIITGPQNERFAQVIANRLWKRYLGWGLVEPVDDWDVEMPLGRGGGTPSHPELLKYLGRQLILSGYDLKAMARLILSSHVYQRTSAGDAGDVPEHKQRLFRGPARRRMTAEQLVDSLFVAAGKELGSEALNLDLDGRRPTKDFLNLGRPRHAWEFASLSNERDRPALSVPIAQSIIDVLKTFGWRETRQDPITVRDDPTTALQPLVLANGIVPNRVATLSDDSAITALCRQEISLERLIHTVHLAVLTRPPDAEEVALFRELLAPGFSHRIVTASKTKPNDKAKKRHAVSWSNHLSAAATRIKMEMERAARVGDTPTRHLDADWRECMEDMVWALINSPEFLFVP